MSAFAAEMTWEEIREKAGATGVALVPAGSTERHGKHLPLGTDSATAAEVARRVGERTGAVVFPNLDYGVEEHPAFGGVFLDDATYAALVRDVCLGIERLGFDKILLISGHGPNNACIFRVLKELFRERPDRRYFGLAHCMTLINQLMPDFVAGRPVGHSDFRETSIMLAINEKLVYPEKASGPETLTQPFAGSLKSAGVHLIGQGGGSIHFCHALGELETHGGYGRVRGASRDRGEAVLSVLADFLSGLVKDLIGLGRERSAKTRPPTGGEEETGA